ncbi:class I mannose-6-phosphate isomerase [Novosphingobium sp. Gsoil 351]|uniref:class I mannose-6-phosphate isomerase n=1 Tax=Novosphingobium sp. Gsoil 351 TaxID=2675225 RepID=UPI0012B47B76|nr:class I mannose-6-phosphate isomerase [Novosphingobium sp. Gsoil 351]QGN55262.1 mannose-6-phosphate isomerase [Novosphingobium sp. Gsoil 351]
MSGLPIRTVAKPWGREVLPPPFAAPPGEKIGEIWFEPPRELPSLLVKYIFTSEKLSVQVHPDDAQACAAGLGANGKEECWLVIDAEPGATLGVGFRKPLSRPAMRAAALDGSIEGLLVWHPVRAGDFFYIPANTVHAIGAGVGLIEVQQNADITYRLYDYGRPRELHLDEGVAVARGELHDPALRRHVAERGTCELADGRYFQLYRIDGEPDEAVRAAYAGPLLVVPLAGAIGLHGEVLEPGGCGYAPGIDAVTFDRAGRCLIARPK